MTPQEIIDHLKHLEKYTHYSDDAPALREVIEMLTETHGERTETNACDLIDRGAAIDALIGQINVTGDINAKAVQNYIRMVNQRLHDMPSAQPDLSEYSDKLWKIAYERGKREAQLDIIRCKDCKHYKFADNRAFGFPMKRCEWTGFEDIDDNDFCSRAERREE